VVVPTPPADFSGTHTAVVPVPMASGQTYEIRHRLRNAGGWSDYSLPLSSMPIPAQPDAGTVSIGAGNEEVTFQWQQSASSEAYFPVTYYKAQLAAGAFFLSDPAGQSAAATSQTLTVAALMGAPYGLASGQAILFQVYACSSIDCGDASPVNSGAGVANMPTSAVSPVPALSLFGAELTDIQVTWSDQEPTAMLVTSYKIEFLKADLSFTESLTDCDGSTLLVI
jgi:hypothetical protein